MLQDTVQSSPTGSSPRFRPYASPNHHVTKGRYITSNDPRGYMYAPLPESTLLHDANERISPVYEYPLNGQWIMMDIDDGYILWTGIWKALGNSKADIVKMIDSQPDLAPLIRRVRGGYLKIQGTWMPYEVALKLSRRVAWAIRDELIPLFGPTFPSTCLSPEQPGYGQVVPTGQNRRRARRSTQNSIMHVPRAHTGWTVVTPTSGGSSTREPPPSSSYPASIRSIDYPLASPYGSHSHGHPRTPSEMHHRSPLQHYSDIRPTPNMETHRYQGSYTNYPPSSYRKPTSPNKIGLSLDVHSLSVREPPPESHIQRDDIKLPPIQPLDGSSTSESMYALPPISAMEDLRGSMTHDSAAVLRRLRMGDDDYSRVGSSSNEATLPRRHSLSARPPSSKSSDTSPRFQPYSTSRSYQDRSGHQALSPPPSSYGFAHSSKIDRSRSDASHEGDSTSNPSPTSPTTPNSLSEFEDCPPSRYSGSIRGKPYPGFADRLGQHWPPALNQSDNRRMSDGERMSMRRHSYEAHSDSDMSHPHRPW